MIPLIALGAAALWVGNTLKAVSDREADRRDANLPIRMLWVDKKDDMYCYHNWKAVTNTNEANGIVAHMDACSSRNPLVIDKTTQVHITDRGYSEGAYWRDYLIVQKSPELGQFMVAIHGLEALPIHHNALATILMGDRPDRPLGKTHWTNIFRKIIAHTHR